MSEVRILVVDDHEMIRQGLRTSLESEKGWVVCGEAATGRDAVAASLALRPGVVIMDLSMPGLNGLEATRQICRDRPDAHVLILTMHESEQLMYEVLEAGARGFVLKSDAGHVLASAVRAICRGKTFFTSKMSDMLVRSCLNPEARNGNGAPSPVTLTSRETEIVQLIAEGSSTKDVACVLGISIKTVETHRANLMRKLGIHSVSEIVRYAIRNKIIDA